MNADVKLKARSMLEVLLLVAFSVAGGSVISTPAASNEWPTASPESVGLAPNLGDRVDKALANRSFHNVHAVVLVRHGKLVLERYRRGDDAIWGSPRNNVAFGPKSLHDIRSITKSVVGLLYGIALNEGKVPGLDRPLVDSFPEYPDLTSNRHRRQMTVRHALTMTLGIKWDESWPYKDRRSSTNAMDRASDSYRYVLEQGFVATPGRTFNYNGGACTLLAKIIARGTASPLDAYAKQRLFTPLGIKNYEWRKGRNGEPVGWSGLRLRPRDLAKIGQLVLAHGQWNGVQVVPAAWLADSMAPKIMVPQFKGFSYGYLWWLGVLRERKVIEASGNGGQELLIVPELDIVLVMTAGNYSNPDAWKPAWTLLEKTVMPAVLKP
jgi:CubicO group peptidase (beta-lactamase class C family)